MTRAALLAGLAAGLVPFVVAELVGSRGLRAARRRGPAALLAGLGRRLGVPVAPGDLGARLSAAGVDGVVRPADLMAAKVGSAAVALLAVAGVVAVLPVPHGRLTLVVAPAAGFLAPDLALRRRAAERRRRIGAELPAILDLLAVAVGAGLAPMRALTEVGRRHGGLLGAELRAAADRVALGVPLVEALGRIEARCHLPAVTALVAALRRAHLHGEPLGAPLADLATDVRADRDRALAEQAARAAPKIQLAIALLLVPGALLLVGAALAGALGG